MRLAFSGEARYADFTDGYRLYCKRARGRKPLDFVEYKRVVREYCKIMSENLVEYGMADIPGGIGTIMAVEIRRN